MPYCKNCGSEVSPDADFCKACGRKIITENHEKTTTEYIPPKNIPQPSLNKSKIWLILFIVALRWSPKTGQVVKIEFCS